MFIIYLIIFLVGGAIAWTKKEEIFNGILDGMWNIKELFDRAVRKFSN